MVEKSQVVLPEVASQLPPDTKIEPVTPAKDVGFQILTETLDWTLSHKLGKVCQGIGNAHYRDTAASFPCRQGLGHYVGESYDTDLKGHSLVQHPSPTSFSRIVDLRALPPKRDPACGSQHSKPCGTFYVIFFYILKSFFLYFTYISIYCVNK